MTDPATLSARIAGMMMARPTRMAPPSQTSQVSRLGSPALPDPGCFYVKWSIVGFWPFHACLQSLSQNFLKRDFAFQELMVLLVFFSLRRAGQVAA
jgi:hypothetical protein